MLDEITRHSIYLQRYASGRYNDILPQLKQLRDELSNRVLNATPFQLARIQNLLTQIDTIIDNSMAIIQPSLFGAMTQLAEYETQWSANLLDKSTVATVTIGATVDPAKIATFLTTTTMEFPNSKPLTIDKMIATFSTRLKKDIKSVITTGLTAGDTTEVIAKNMVALNNTRTREQAKTVVLTIANHVGNESRINVWSEYSELLSGLKYSATLDSRTTILCASRDGNIYPIEKHPSLPAHWRCRSQYVPQIKDEYDLGIGSTRASIDGQVSSKTTYQSWLERQPKSVVDEVLGETRSKLFRNGDIKLDQFLDNSGKTYTLEQLKSRDLLK